MNWLQPKFIIPISIIVGVLATFTAYRFIENKIETVNEEKNAKEKVVVAAKDLSIGTMLLPNLMVEKEWPRDIVNISKRQKSVESGLVDALDLLIICVEAGLGLNAAILRVGQDLKLRAPTLGDEFIFMNKEMRSGLSRQQALRNLTLRNNVEDLKILVSSIILADRLGTSIADTLRAQAESLRTRISQRAEEHAGKASIKMLFPLVIFIFPALFIVILGPGFLNLLKMFSEMSGP
jgi:Flp pilus assembly protein TadB